MKLRTLATSATLAAAILLSAHVALAATPTPQAGKALQYLGTQQLADGSVDDSLGETADYALGAKFHGLDPNTLKASSGKSVYDYLAAWTTASVACSAKGNARDGNTIGKLVQAVVAGGHDPKAFGGRNLLADLEGPGGTNGGAYDASTGTFQDCASGGKNAVYAQANAMLALTIAGDPTHPLPAAAIQHLRALQSAGGGWATFGSVNSNATAMALMALAPLQTFCGAPQDPVLRAALAYLHTQQDPASGGFTYSTAFGTASDPDSDALVIQALVSVLEDPAGSAWTNAKGNATTDILTFQDPTTGGFKFDHGAATQPDAFTTSEVPAGLDRAPFPAGSAHPIAVLCAFPSPTPSATAPGLPRAGNVHTPGDPAAPWRGNALGIATLLLVATVVLLPALAVGAREVGARRLR
jgi:hypothetical protein